MLNVRDDGARREIQRRDTSTAVGPYRAARARAGSSYFGGRGFLSIHGRGRSIHLCVIAERSNQSSFWGALFFADVIPGFVREAASTFVRKAASP